MDEQFRGTVSGAYRAFHAELLKFLGKRLGSQADAADLAQDAFAQWLGSRDCARVAQPAPSCSRSLATSCATTGDASR